jgi:hypothetical protein
MPKKINGKPVDETKWAKAKAIAAEEGHAEDYKYIMGIYKKMTGMKSVLTLGSLMKGRKGVADGTIKDVKGTPYKRMKQGKKWIHVKVSKTGQITNMAGQVIGQAGGTPGSSGSTGTTAAPNMAGVGTGVNDGVKRGRGRPPGAKNKPKVAPPVAPPAAPPAPVQVISSNAKKRGRPRKAAVVAAVEVKKTNKTTSSKKESEQKKREVHQIGDRVLRKNSAGNYYWSTKQSDGTWSYDGLASPAEVKVYLALDRKKKKAEKERAESEKKKAELAANKKDTAGIENSEWNADGTPKQAALDKMGTKEKIYWTKASERARDICDKSGVLCMDVEAEDYILLKLNDVFKADSDTQAVVDAVHADTPLDTDAKFADDHVFMMDTLAKLEEYEKDIKDNEKDYKERIRNKMRQEFDYNTRSNRSSSVPDQAFESKLEGLASDAYHELENSVGRWINKIKTDDENRINVIPLRELDKKLSGIALYTAIPSMLVDNEFGNDIAEFMNDPLLNGDNSVSQFLKSINIDSPERSQRMLNADVIGDRNSQHMLTKYELIHGIIGMVLNPNFTEDDFKPLFVARTAPNGDIRLPSINVKRVPNAQGWGTEPALVVRGDPEYMPFETFMEGVNNLRVKYSALSEALGKVTVVPASTHENLRDIDNEYGGGFYHVMEHWTNAYMKGNRDDTSMKWDDISSVIESAVKSRVSKTPRNEGTKDEINKFLDAAKELKGTSIDRVQDSIKLKLNEKYRMLKGNLKDYVLLPDAVDIAPNIGMTSYSHHDSSYVRSDESQSEFTFGPANKIGNHTLRSYNIKNLPGDKAFMSRHEYSILRYKKFKYDKKLGGGKIEVTRENRAETRALREAVRASWNNDLTTIKSAANHSYYSDRPGAKNHSSASLAVAIGLNWQVRKITKQKNVIPEWKWYESTKPFDMKNKLNVLSVPTINNPTIQQKQYTGLRGAATYRQRYGRRITQNVNVKSQAGDAHFFTEDDYRLLLTNAKNESIAVELGLVDKSAPTSASGKAPPKIVMRTAQNIDEIRKEFKDRWTHKKGNFNADDFEIHRAFDIMYHDYYDQYKKRESSLGNVKIVFTSTDFLSGAPIMKGGFKFMPIRNGNMLGLAHSGQITDRIYSTPSTSKTCQYLERSFGRSGHGVMFRCRMAAGNMNSSGAGMNAAIHDPAYNTVYGEGDPTGMKKYGLDHDEYAVKDPMQMIPIQWIDVGKKGH